VCDFWNPTARSRCGNRRCSGANATLKPSRPFQCNTLVPVSPTVGSDSATNSRPSGMVHLREDPSGPVLPTHWLHIIPIPGSGASAFRCLGMAVRNVLRSRTSRSHSLRASSSAIIHSGSKMRGCDRPWDRHQQVHPENLVCTCHFAI